MKKRILLWSLCALVTSTASAQIIQSASADMPIWGTVENTGIAMAPNYSWNAIVYDDPSGDYYIQWRDPGTYALLDQDNQPGSNPDVAYYADESALVVAYENSGGIWVDDYYLATVVPVNYNLNTNTPVSGGFNPNIDMSSTGLGVLTWEDGGGNVMMCTFTVAPFTPGPVVMVAPGKVPDVALLDDGQNIVITYEQFGNLVIETYDWPSLAGGSLVPTSPNYTFPTGGTGFSHPRVQANRHVDYGSVEDYTIVAQDHLGGGIFDVWSYFFNGLGAFTTSQHVNPALVGCSPTFPRPVVAYNLGEVHVAFSTDYSCSFPPGDPSAQDVLMVHYDHTGNLIAPTPTPTDFLEVNNFNLDFTFSNTSLNSTYDGFGIISVATSCEGVAFHNPGDLMWKVRTPAIPNWRTSGPEKYVVSVDKGVTDNIITVEVAANDETLTANDLEMTFALYDQSGRVVDIPAFEQNEMVYRIDASSLEHGIYLLHYTLNGETKAVRIPHFTH